MRYIPLFALLLSLPAAADNESLQIVRATSLEQTAPHTETDALLQDVVAPVTTAPARQHQIQRMQQALLYYRELAATHDWPAIPKGPYLRLGDTHPHIALLRSKLLLLNDLDASAYIPGQEQVMDPALEQALKNFQQRHGRKVDGILGPGSRRELNISPGQRADQIQLNIHRQSNFTPRTDRYIQVNIPEFRLRLFEHDKPVLNMKTIVGRSKRKTPVFDTEVDRIVINPSWHVPKSIAYKDILPALKEDPEYLTKINLKLVTGYGNQQKVLPASELDQDRLYRGDNFQRFWEPPGEGNTLGKVKFLTSGPYAVYLHDTSAKRLFESDRRAFSSGCIRLEQPRQLADELMRMTHGWSKTRLDPLFSQTRQRYLKLPDPIPLYVIYWTSFIDDQGRLNFRPDLYKRDRHELAQLNH
ncbi:L,D-transpeptidase family protein [Neptuniibacter halophilus]|uniref:L,D-transpeptidase family protein n=1 Tax=Neptuniibacter halophilus TaxID=651666 RepID=UPI0025726141|nr:L,D-transpeptidase family protein [Neptuniibacter halophilus]